MLRRPAALALAVVAVVALPGCRRDTIRTTSGTVTTSAAGGTTTSAGGAGRKGSTTVKGSGTTAAGGGTATTRPGGTGGSLVLGGGDLGATSLGTPADDAVAAVTDALGSGPTRDVKDPGSECPGPQRIVRWGRFSLLFADGKLAGWAYDATPEGPPELATPSGITIGSTVATVRRVYGDKAKIDPGDPPYPATFEVAIGSSALIGTLTGTTDTSTVTALTFGLTCGE